MKRTRFGIGPAIALPAAVLSLATWLATSAWPAVFLLRFPAALRIAGAALIGLGLVLWGAGGVKVMRAYDRGELLTTGVYALVRNPMYAGWITLVFPGLALLTGWWLFLLIALLGYVMFTLLIHHEDDYLEGRFGKAYVAYRGRVNAVVPIPRFR